MERGGVGLIQDSRVTLNSEKLNNNIFSSRNFFFSCGPHGYTLQHENIRFNFPSTVFIFAVPGSLVIFLV